MFFVQITDTTEMNLTLEMFEANTLMNGILIT